MIRVLFGLAGVALLTVGAIAMGSPPLTFVDVPSLVFVVGLVGTGTLLSFSPAQVLGALSPTSDPETAAAVFHRMADLSVTSGIFGVIIGLIQMLRYLDDPTVIGPAMAVCLLTLFYGVGLGELVFRGLATGRAAETAPRSHSRRGAVSVYLPLTAVLLILTMLAVIASIFYLP